MFVYISQFFRVCYLASGSLRFSRWNWEIMRGQKSSPSCQLCFEFVFLCFLLGIELEIISVSHSPWYWHMQYPNTWKTCYLVQFHLSLNPDTQMCKENPFQLPNLHSGDLTLSVLEHYFWPLLFCTWQQNKINTFFSKVLSTSRFVEDVITAWDSVFPENAG